MDTLGLKRLASTLMVLLPIGCATVPPCPAKGGPTWRELTSEHFALRSDLDLDDAIDLIRTLEESRAGMLTGMWPGTNGPPGLTQVIALSSGAELSAYLGTVFVGLHAEHPPFPGTLIIGGLGRRPETTAKHELAHHLARYFLPLEPAWYSEGLATFLSTVRYDRATGRSSLGETSEDNYLFFRTGTLLSPPALLGSIPKDQFEISRFYATSWLLTHYLINHRATEFKRFRHRLGELEPGVQAFRAEFPDLTDENGFITTLMAYAQTGSYKVAQVVVPPWTASPRVRVLADGEVHGVRAFLWSVAAQKGEERRAAVRAELDEALQAAPPPLDALAVAFYVTDLGYAQNRATLAARAVEAHPADWMSWLMMADAARPGDPTGRSALLRAFGLAPREPEILVRLALLRGNERRWDDALGFSSQVLGEGARHHQLWLLHLTALIETDHCPEAILWGKALVGYLDPAEAGMAARLMARPCDQPGPGTSPAPPTDSEATARR